jgi:hypothetical protein
MLWVPIRGGEASLVLYEEASKDFRACVAAKLGFTGIY